jgi:hypothetical protein
MSTPEKKTDAAPSLPPAVQAYQVIGLATLDKGEQPRRSTADKVASPDAALPPPAQVYQVIGLASMVVLGAALFQYGCDRWSLVPVLVGTAGLAFRWRSAAPTCLVAVAFTLVARSWVGNRFIVRQESTLIVDLALALALVVYALSHNRLLSLTVGVLPPDPLRPKEKPPPRPTDGVATTEVPLALLTALGAALAARFVWELTDLSRPAWEVETEYWRVGQIVWGLTVLFLALTAVIGYLGRRVHSSDEAALFLRDTLWAETRREQRRIQRWTAWAKWRVGR